MGRDNLAEDTVPLPIFLYRTLSRNSPGKYMRLAESTRTRASKEDNGRFKQRKTIKRMYRSRNRNKRGQLTMDLLRQRSYPDDGLRSPKEAAASIQNKIIP